MAVTAFLYIFKHRANKGSKPLSLWLGAGCWKPLLQNNVFLFLEGFSIQHMYPCNRGGCQKIHHNVVVRVDVCLRGNRGKCRTCFSQAYLCLLVVNVIIYLQKGMFGCVFFLNCGFSLTRWEARIQTRIRNLRLCYQKFLSYSVHCTHNRPESSSFPHYMTK